MYRNLWMQKTPELIKRRLFQKKVSKLIFQSLIMHNVDAIFILSLTGEMICFNRAGKDIVDIKRRIRSVLSGFILQVKKDKQAIKRDVDLTTEI
ncbi:histidine kinase [Bacillus sp. ISL-32]|nr:histidine kinase [Bacillus sp. ISL-32]